MDPFQNPSNGKRRKYNSQQRRNAVITARIILVTFLLVAKARRLVTLSISPVRRRKKITIAVYNAIMNKSGNP